MSDENTNNTPATPANNGFANSPAQPSVDVLGVLSGLQQNSCKVVHGAAEGVHPVALNTVSAVRGTFSVAYNIPAEAQAFVDGVLVNEDYILQPNETLEFVKAAGVKG